MRKSHLVQFTQPQYNSFASDLVSIEVPFSFEPYNTYQLFLDPSDKVELREVSKVLKKHGATVGCEGEILGL